MEPFDEVLDPGATRPVYTSRRRRSGTSAAARHAVPAAAVFLVAGGVGWYWLRTRVAPPDPSLATATTPPVEATPPARGYEAPEPDLPVLEASDAVVRPLVRALSSHPEVARWLATDGLVRSYVFSVVNVSAGESPTERLGLLAPEGDFAARESGARTVVARSSYRRYDVLTEAFVSLDAAGVALLHRRLEPLFDDACRELGLPDGSFDDMLARAMGRLLAVPVPAGPVAVVPSRAGYAFADPELETLSPAAKHLLRTGPENARRIQAKVRELAEAMGVEPRAPGGGAPTRR